MLLLSSPRNGRQRRASLLLLALLCVVPVGESLPAGIKCHLDCAREGRQFCRPGSSYCGPCLASLEENEEGLCVARKKHRQHGKVTSYVDLDEEIDYLHSVIEKLQVAETKPPKKSSKHPAAVTSLTDAPKQKSHSRLSDESPDATTVAPPGTATSEPIKATGLEGRVGPIAVPSTRNNKILIVIIALCVAVALIAVILATACFVKLQKHSRLAEKVDYPAFGGAGPPASTANGSSVGDKTLAQSAQMYHYQHQKQQMLSIGNIHKPEPKAVETDVTSDEEEVGGDFTVYECPGLAPTGEMEVKNPLFDDSTLHYQGNHQ